MYIVIKVQCNKNTLNISYKATQLSSSRRHVVASQSLCSQAERLIYLKESKKIFKLINFNLIIQISQYAKTELTITAAEYKLNLPPQIQMLLNSMQDLKYPVRT